MDRRSDELAHDLKLLLNYVARRTRYYEATGDLRPHALDPEQIVRNVYLEAGSQLHGAPHARASYRWLRALADHVLVREVRRVCPARAPREGLPEAGRTRPLPELCAAANAVVAAEAAAAAELQRALARVLGDLPEPLRETFLLRIVDGYHRDEIAAIEGISPNEGDRLVARASLLLRARLAREYGEREAPRLEELFRRVERLEPSAATDAYARAQLEVAPTPSPPTAA